MVWLSVSIGFIHFPVKSAPKARFRRGLRGSYMAVQTNILVSRCERDEKPHLVCVVADLKQSFEERFSTAMICAEDSFAEKNASYAC